VPSEEEKEHEQELLLFLVRLPVSSSQIGNFMEVGEVEWIVRGSRETLSGRFVAAIRKRPNYLRSFVAGGSFM
jgi:hypothetical protein